MREGSIQAELASVLEQTCHALEPPLHRRVAEELVAWQRVHGAFRGTRAFATALRGLESELRAEHPSLKLPSIVKTSLRIFLNHEMPQLRLALDAAFARLAHGGRVCVICFNRWEVAAVRAFVRDHEEPSISDVFGGAKDSHLYPLEAVDHARQDWAVRRVAKPIRPTAEELRRNQRAKSSLHVLEKVARSVRR